MDASLEVTILLDYNTDGTAGPETQIQCRLGAQSAHSQFDTVDITVQSFIESEIGTKAARKCTNHVTTRKTWEDFELSSKSQTYADLVVTLPCGHRDAMLPTMLVSGSKYVTRSAVLSDQHLVHGKCGVSHWVVAEFKREGRLVRRVKRQFEISPATAPYMLIPLPTSLQDSICDVKPQTTALLRKGWPLKSKSKVTPRFSLIVGHQWSSCCTSKQQSVFIPLTMSMLLSLLFGNSYSVQNLLERGIEGCIVRAKWYKRQTFATSGLMKSDDDLGGLKITKETVAEQETTLNFPPLYQEDVRDTNYRNETVPRLTKFSASSMLELILPSSVSTPSISTDLLKISYQLELSFSFKQRCAQSAILPWSTHLTIPVTVEMA